MTEPASISDELQAELDRLGAKGDELAAEGNHEAAIEIYRAGFAKIPPPKEGRFAGLWFTIAIGDAQWFAHLHREALDSWRDALLFYGDFGNPFVHLRRGQSLYELGDEKEAANELLRALLIGGEDVFAREPIDYRAFITAQARAPEGYPGWIGWPGFDKDSEEYRKWTDPTDVYRIRHKPSA